MTHTQSLRDLANEIAVTNPSAGRRLHAVAQQVHTMEQAWDEAVEQARAEAWREWIESRGVVALPVGVWGRG